MSGIVDSVEEGFPADLAGLKRQDRIFSINKKNILEEHAKVSITMLEDYKSYYTGVDIGVMRSKMLTRDYVSYENVVHDIYNILIVIC